MLGIAPGITAWRARNRGLPVASLGAVEPGGVPFLDGIPAFNALWPQARLIVEWAPGADLTDSGGSSWTWVDITEDVLQADGRRIDLDPRGRADASSVAQPAGCAFTLDNRSGRYSQGPQGANYPNVKLNIPVRVRITLTGRNDDAVAKFQGYSYSLRPAWDSTGRFSIVDLKAAGITRRLQQGSTPLRSAIARGSVRTTPAPIAYWPMEDESGSTSFASGLSGGTPMSVDGTWNLAQYTGVAGSDSLPTMTPTADFKGIVVGKQTNQFQVSWIMNVPAAPVAQTSMMRLKTKGGAIGRWDINIPAGSTTSVTVVGTDVSGAIIVNSTVAIPIAAQGPLYMRFCTKQNGGNIDYQLTVFPVIPPLSGLVTTGSTAGTWGTLAYVSSQADPTVAGKDGVSIGHITVMDAYNDDDILFGPVYGWLGETATTRIGRLCNEEKIPRTITGTGRDQMGVQSVATLMTLLRECEATDQGVLLDGLTGGGLRYIARGSRENQNTKLPLDASTGDIQPPFQPEDDDQKVINTATVNRSGGSSATFIDTDGPLGTDAILDYATSLTVNTRYDDILRDIAAWLVHQGTVEGYRYPSLSIDLRTIPELAQLWLSLIPTNHVTISNIASYVGQHAPGDIEMVVDGHSNRLSRFEWSADLNCSPASSWQVAVLATDDTADDNEDTWVLDTDEGASLTRDLAPVGSTSIVINTSVYWTLSLADFPLVLSVGGYRVNVTAIAGAVSPQTLTCDPLSYSIPPGAEVKLWAPNVLAL